MTYSIEEMLSNLVKLDENQWGGYAFYHEPLERKFSKEQKVEYISRANQCGREEAQKLRQRFPGASVREMAEGLGLTVKTPQTPTGGGHVIFAQYMEPAQITIFRDCIEKAETVIRENHLDTYFSEDSLEDILLAHELFHGMEYQNRKTIYTQTEKIELWRRPFSNKSRILCLSEMAAMAFAGELTEMCCSPYVLDVFLMYGYNKEAASALYEEILEAAGVRERGEEEC